VGRVYYNKGPVSELRLGQYLVRPDLRALHSVRTISLLKKYHREKKYKTAVGILKCP
jgi:hypothetical protein